MGNSDYAELYQPVDVILYCGHGVVAYEVWVEQNKDEGGVVPFLAPEDIVNPEIAKKYNIPGYFEIPDTKRF